MGTEPAAERKGGEWRPVVTLDRRTLIAILVGVCILSSAVGAGIGLIAETGPAGVPGERGPAGPEGPEGPEGPSGAAEIGGLEEEVEELRDEIEGGSELEATLEDLEGEIDDLREIASELCLEIDAFC
jgi:hypothetical protein